jgi:hypothetical protein
MLKPFLQALVVSPFLALLIAMLFCSPSPEYQAQRAEELRVQAMEKDRAITTGVGVCLEKMGPWVCYKALKSADVDHPIRGGEARTARFASISSAKDVLEFCDLPRKVDCANQMFGNGYRMEDVQVALKSFGELNSASDGKQ